MMKRVLDPKAMEQIWKVKPTSLDQAGHKDPEEISYIYMIDRMVNML